MDGREAGRKERTIEEVLFSVVCKMVARARVCVCAMNPSRPLMWLLVSAEELCGLELGPARSPQTETEFFQGFWT